jgi:hypothetical protein
VIAALKGEELDHKPGLLENHSTAIVAGAVAISPPLAVDVAKVTALAPRVDEMTVDTETFRGVLALAKDALETYGKIRAA